MKTKTINIKGLDLLLPFCSFQISAFADSHFYKLSL